MTPGLVEEEAAADNKGGVTILRARTNLEKITALRIELRPAAGAKAPKDAEPFTLREISVEAAPLDSPDKKRKVSFAVLNTGSTIIEAGAPKIIDGDLASGWAPAGIAEGKTRTLLLIPATPIGGEGGTELRIVITHNRSSAFEQMGVFQTAVSTDPDLAPLEAGPWHVSGPYRAADGKEAFAKAYPPEAGIDLEAVYEDGRRKWAEARPALPDGELNELPGATGATYLYRRITSPTARNVTLSLGTRDAIKLWLNGKLVHSAGQKRKVKAGQDTVTLRLNKGDNALLMKLASYGETHVFHYRKAH